jgi:signal transduction histidine kinase
MKSSLSRQLILYFSSLLIVFAIILTLVFSIVTNRQTKQDIQTALITTVSELKELIELNRGMGISRDRLESSLRNVGLNDVQAWLVYQDGRISLLSQTRMGMMRERFDITDRTQSIINRVLNGETVLNETLSGVFDQETTTVGMPIMFNRQVTAGIFVSASNQAIANLNRTSLRVLFISLIIGLGVAMLIGYAVSLRFLRPLQKASHAVNALADGRFDVALEVSGDDELSQLSKNINVLAKRLYHAHQQTEQLEEQRKSFFADITHELRTPITIIRGLMEGIRDGIKPEVSVNEIANQVLNETKGMQRLVQDILDLTKLEDPNFKMNFERLDLNLIFQDLHRSAQALAQHKKQSIDFDYPFITQAFVGDAQRLKQMWMIVLDNAIAYSPEGSNIRFESKLEQNILAIKISDQGPGMPQTQLDELFQRYKTTNQANGNGLGLLIAHKIASAHKISLKVVSEVGVGTQLVFSLNLSKHKDSS